MIVRSRGGYREVRGFDDPVIDRLPVRGATYATEAGVGITYAKAVGLPAVLGVMQLATWPAAQLPCMVYRPIGEGSEKARDTLQWTLLHDKPYDGFTPLQVWWTVLASMIGHGGAGLLKLKTPTGKVVGLVPQDPARFTVMRKDGRLVFRFRNKGRTVDLTRSEVLYIPGDLTFDPEIGVSALTVARETIGVGRAQQLFEGRYYATDGSPKDIVTIPGNPTPDVRRDFSDSWESTHTPGARRLGLLWGGMTYEPVTVNLRDAEYAESSRITRERCADILGLPVTMLDPENDTSPDETHKRYRELFLQPKLTAIEQALHADDDLFPDKQLFPRFLTSALLRPSLKDRADSYRLFRQGGVMTANELRALEDLPPHPDGDELQQTPVGGAPNPKLDPQQPASDLAAAQQ